MGAPIKGYQPVKGKCPICLELVPVRWLEIDTIPVVSADGVREIRARLSACCSTLWLDEREAKEDFGVPPATSQT